MLLVLVVVPAALSHELSQNFDWWLGTELFFLWHVKIINKDNSLHSESWTVDTKSDLVKLAINDILNLVAMSLSRETNFNSQVLLTWQLVEQHVLDIDRLTSTGWTDEQGWDRLLDAVLLDVRVSELINGCDNDVLWLGILWELVNVVLVEKIGPVLPLILVWEVDVVIDSSTIHNTWHDLAALELLETIDLTIANFLDVEIKWASVLGVHDTAD